MQSCDGTTSAPVTDRTEVTHQEVVLLGAVDAGEVRPPSLAEHPSIVPADWPWERFITKAVPVDPSPEARP